VENSNLWRIKMAKKIQTHTSARTKRGASKRKQNQFCPRCGQKHSISQHSSHGKGSFARVRSPASFKKATGRRKPSTKRKSKTKRKRR